MSIVIVGGNERMVCQYEDICKGYGCKAKVFAKEKGAMKKKIGAPDLMILFTGTVSHKMVNCAVEEAKKKYAKEAKERWGDTEAYRESEKKTSGYGEEKWRALNGEMSDIFREFAECANAGETPEGSRVAGLVERWRNHITENDYECTLEILEGLEKMYVGGRTF